MDLSTGATAILAPPALINRKELFAAPTLPIPEPPAASVILRCPWLAFPPTGGPYPPSFTDASRMTLLTIEDCVALETRWREPHRHYHGVRHLEECLARFADVRALAQDADAVEAALWFHDAVHDVHRDDNEARSAALARTMLEARGVAAERIAHVEAIILATRHETPSADPDAQLACDIDLAILGADVTRFDEYERGVRAEYAWVPMPIFRVKRAEILMRFLASPRIFQTEWFHARFDAAARDNLSRALKALRGT